MPTGELMTEYQRFQQALDSIGALANPAEAHGVLIGMWIGGGPTEQSRWLAELVEEDEEPQAVPAELADLYRDLAEQVTTADNLGLDLVLPGDDEPLKDQVEGLIDFAQGVLYGYAIENGPARRALADEAREVFDDLGDIAQLDPESVGGKDDAFDIHQIELNGEGGVGRHLTHLSPSVSQFGRYDQFSFAPCFHHAYSFFYTRHYPLQAK